MFSNWFCLKFKIAIVFLKVLLFLNVIGKNERIIVFGTGKNLKFLEKLNKVYHFTPELVPLEHPRYVMQYKYKHREQYIAKYLESFML